MVVFWKLFSSKKFCILDSYCVIGSMTTELPLSARVIMALFCTLDWIDFISLDFGCSGWGLGCSAVVVYLCGLQLVFCRLPVHWRVAA